MTVRTTTRPALHGWLFYDSHCSLCTATAGRFRDTLARRGYRLVPSGLWPELRLLTSDGHTQGGADAVFYIARRIWWAWPLWALAQLPGMRRLALVVYRWIAAHRYILFGRCDSGACAVPTSPIAHEMHKEA